MVDFKSLESGSQGRPSGKLWVKIINFSRENLKSGIKNRTCPDLNFLNWKIEIRTCLDLKFSFDKWKSGHIQVWNFPKVNGNLDMSVLFLFIDKYQSGLIELIRTSSPDFNSFIGKSEYYIHLLFLNWNFFFWMCPDF